MSRSSWGGDTGIGPKLGGNLSSRLRSHRASKLQQSTGERLPDQGRIACLKERGQLLSEGEVEIVGTEGQTELLGNVERIIELQRGTPTQLASRHYDLRDIGGDVLVEVAPVVHTTG